MPEGNLHQDQQQYMHLTDSSRRHLKGLNQVSKELLVLVQGLVLGPGPVLGPGLGLGLGLVRLGWHHKLPMLVLVLVLPMLQISSL